jgi:hypothetical protein
MQAAITLFNRLTEVEKIGLRMATPGTIEHLADTVYRGDLRDVEPAERAAVLTETAALAQLQFVAAGASNQFGRTWLY